MPGVWFLNKPGIASARELLAERFELLLLVPVVGALVERLLC